MRRGEIDRIAITLGFGHGAGLDSWVRRVEPLAHSLQSIAPAEARDGPNPEYPWPHEAPAHCPIDHRFALWTQLTDSAHGRRLLVFVEHAINRFEHYG